MVQRCSFLFPKHMRASSSHNSHIILHFTSPLHSLKRASVRSYFKPRSLSILCRLLQDTVDICVMSRSFLPSWKTSSRLEGSGSSASCRAAAASSSRTWVCQLRLCCNHALRFSQDVGLSTDASMVPGHFQAFLPH